MDGEGFLWSPEAESVPGGAHGLGPVHFTK